MKKILLIIPLLAILFSCARNSENEPNSLSLNIGRLDLSVLASANVDSATRIHVADSFAPALKAIALTERREVTPYAMFDDILNSSYFPVFAPDVASKFPNLNLVERELSVVYSNLAANLKDVELPKLTYAYVSPYRQSVVVVDTVLLIALNHYLGSDYPGYEGIDIYQRRLKTPDRISLDVAEALIRISRPMKSEIYATPLSRMLHEGAIVALMNKLRKDDTFAHVLGYTDEQLKWCVDHERDVWSRLASSGILYSSSPVDGDRLVNPAPSTSIVHPDAPGRLGRFVGARIVSSYMKNNPDKDFDFLLSPAFYSDGVAALKAAGYEP